MSSIPKTFGRWYLGNISQDDAAAWTDGRALVAKTVKLTKRAYQQITKTGHIGARQQPDFKMMDSVINRFLDESRELCFLTTDTTEGDSGLCQRLHAGEHSEWFNILALNWLLDNVAHTRLELSKRGAVLFFNGDNFAALLMPVSMPATPSWVNKLAELARA